MDFRFQLDLQERMWWLVVPVVLSMETMFIGLIGCKPVKPSVVGEVSSTNQSGDSIDASVLGQSSWYLNQGFASFEDFALFEQCQISQKFYDRASTPNSGRCTEVSLARSYDCTHDGIKEKFKSIGVDLQLEEYGSPVQTFFKGFLGFEIDQCGEFDNEPIISLLRYDRSDVAVDSVEVRFLCKTASKACLSSHVE